MGSRNPEVCISSTTTAPSNNSYVARTLAPHLRVEVTSLYIQDSRDSDDHHLSKHIDPKKPWPASGLQKLDKQPKEGCNKPAIWNFQGMDPQRYVYNPKPEKDPFENSRSLRHQQPCNPRRKRRELDSDEEDEEGDSDLDDENARAARAEKEERAYKELLPRVKQLLTELGADEKWVLDKEEKPCMVCTFPQRLKGWKALLQHAENFRKKKPIRHRAYFRALTECLESGPNREADENAETKAVLIESGSAPEDLIVWPPVVIVDNIKENEYLNRYVPKLKPSDVSKTIRFSHKGRPGRMLVVFPASEVGHLNSTMVVDSLAKLASVGVDPSPISTFPPGHLLQIPRLPPGQVPQISKLPPGSVLPISTFPPGQVPPISPFPTAHFRQIPPYLQGFHSYGNRHSPRYPPPGHMHWAQALGQQRQRYPPAYMNGAPHWAQEQGHGLRVVAKPPPPTCFLAKSADMMVMDPQRKLTNWSLQNKREVLKCVLKRSKEEHELEKAKVKAKLVEVDSIAESHQEFKSRKAILSQQLRDAEMALDIQKKREEHIAKEHAKQLQMMDEKFKEELRELETERVKREKKLRALLHTNEKKLATEKFQRIKEVQYLMQHFENVTQKIQQQKAQKAIEKEREITRKRAKVMEEIKQKEAKFNEEGRHVERRLLEKQEAEKIKFLEEYNKMRQEFLNEWVAKQAMLKEKAEKAKQEKEKLLMEAKNKEMGNQIKQENAECSVCFSDFDETTKRALIQPCGHAKICVACATGIFCQTRLCPICRVKMSSKPKIIPAKLYL